jgi:hypothetical protein
LVWQQGLKCGISAGSDFPQFLLLRLGAFDIVQLKVSTVVAAEKSNAGMRIAGRALPHEWETLSAIKCPHPANWTELVE